MMRLRTTLLLESIIGIRDREEAFFLKHVWVSEVAERKKRRRGKGIHVELKRWIYIYNKGFCGYFF